MNSLGGTRTFRNFIVTTHTLRNTGAPTQSCLSVSNHGFNLTLDLRRALIEPDVRPYSFPSPNTLVFVLPQWIQSKEGDKETEGEDRQCH